ncbi:hypothetical protein [Streptomyces noursei]|uniref:hypothetical protein n=1 Tax=Streptomyces noursei TaxID=1971 RepID=UPI00167394B4|nr:hypothetical protein [Streptomyces noursei]MCZ1013055.1 hypothetical protein [Streptomyces noursei]
MRPPGHGRHREPGQLRLAAVVHDTAAAGALLTEAARIACRTLAGRRASYAGSPVAHRVPGRP